MPTETLQAQGDIFDQVSSASPKQDVFDEVASRPSRSSNPPGYTPSPPSLHTASSSVSDEDLYQHGMAAQNKPLSPQEALAEVRRKNQVARQNISKYPEQDRPAWASDLNAPMPGKEALEDEAFQHRVAQNVAKEPDEVPGESNTPGDLLIQGAQVVREKMAQKGAETGGRFTDWLTSDTGNPQTTFKPEARGALRGVGKTVGAVAADPFTYVAGGASSAAGKTGARMISGAFAADMGVGAYDQYKEVKRIWDRPDVPREAKAEATSSLIMQALMAGAATKHALTPHPIAVPPPDEATQALINYEKATGNPQFQEAPKPAPQINLDPEHLQNISAALANLPHADRQGVITKLHPQLAEQLLKTGSFLGPDGKLHIVKTPEEAGKLAQQFINDAVDSHDKRVADEQKVQAEAAKTAAKEPAPSQPSTAVRRFMERSRPAQKATESAAVQKTVQNIPENIPVQPDSPLLNEGIKQEASVKISDNISENSKPPYSGTERRTNRLAPDSPAAIKLGGLRTDLRQAQDSRDIVSQHEIQQEIERESAIASGKQVEPQPAKVEDITPEDVRKHAQGAPGIVAPVKVQSVAKVEPGQVGEVNPKELSFDPKRFQYKTGVNDKGVTNQFAGGKFNPDLAGIVSVWRDASDGKTYVVNGHHRAQLALDNNSQGLVVRHIAAKDATEARSIGALQNIAEGRGTAIDAAKFFRDTNYDPDKLRGLGVFLTEAKVKDGLALSRLDPFIFEKVSTGEIPESRAIAIGEATNDPAQQEAIFKLLEKREARGQKVTNETVSELARFVSSSGNRTVEQGGLFGANNQIHSLALEKAEISAYIKSQIGKEKRAFAAVASPERAQTLARVEGQQIKAQENRKISDAAAQAEEAYNKLSSYAGPVSEALNKAARDLASGHYKPEDIKQRAYSSVRDELRKTLSGAAAEGGGRGQEDPSGPAAASEAEQPLYSVEETEIKTGENDWQHREYSGPSGDEAISRLRDVARGNSGTASDGMAAKGILDEIDSGRAGFTSAMQKGGTTSLAELIGGNLTLPRIESTPVHSLDITPSMRDSVLYEGQPLFSREPGAGMSSEEIRSFVKQAGGKLRIEEAGSQGSLFGEAEKVYRLKNSSGQSTLVTQTQMDALRKDFPALDSKVTGEGVAQPGLFNKELTDRFKVEQKGSDWIIRDTDDNSIADEGFDSQQEAQELAGSMNRMSSGGQVSFSYKPPQGAEPPTLTISLAARDLIADVAKMPSQSRGVNFDRALAERVAEEVRSMADGDKDNADELRALADAINNAASESGDKGVNLVLQGAPESVGREESFHGGFQRELGQGDVRNHLPEAAYDRLLGHFTAAEFEGQYKGTYYETAPKYIKVAEIAAKIASDPNRFSPAQAAHWFSKYIEELEAHHGEEKIGNLSSGLYDRVKELYDQAKRQISERVSARERRPAASESRAGKVDQSGPERATGPPPESDRAGNPQDAGGKGGVEPPLYSLRDYLSRSQERRERRYYTGQARHLESEVSNLDRQYEASQLDAIDLLKSANTKFNAADEEAAYHASEDRSEIASLTPEQKDLKDNWVDPLKQENDSVRAELKYLGWDKPESLLLPFEDDDVQYIHRVAQGKGGRLESALEGGKRGKGNTLSKSAASLKGRPMLAAEDADGHRVVVHVGDDQITGFENGRVFKFAEGQKGLRPGITFKDTDGQEWKLKDASTREIEQHSPVRYYKNALAVTVDDNLQLNRALNAARFLENFKARPEFKTIAVKPEAGERAPDGWQESPLPQFKDYYFEPRTYEVLKDLYDRTHSTKMPGMLEKVGDFLQASILLNPLMHAGNMADIFINERGIARNAAIWKGDSAVRAGMRAISAVMKRNDDFKAALRNGAWLMSHRQVVKNVNSLLFKTLTQAAAENPSLLSKVRDFMGISPEERNPVEAIRNASHSMAFASNDIFYLQRVYEKMDSGMELQQAIRDTNKTFPEYRVPTRVLDSKWAADMLKNRLMTWFSGYHYGRWRAYRNMVADGLGRDVDPTARAKAFSRMGMLAFMVVAGYPLYNQLLKKATGDPNAKSKAFGISALPADLVDVARGRKQLPQVIESQVTPSALFRAGLETAVNRDTFTGSRVYDPTAPIGTEFEQTAGHFLRNSIGPVSQYQRFKGQPDATKKFLFSQIGVSFPKSESRSRAENLMHDLLREKQMITPDRQREMEARRQQADEGHKTYGQMQAEHKKQALGELRYYLSLRDFNYADVKRVYEAATPEEKEIIKPIMRMKAMRLLQSNPWEAQREHVLDDIRGQQ